MRARRSSPISIASIAVLAVFAAPLVPARAGETVRVSVATDGTEGDGASGSAGGRQSITPDGRFVTFESAATNFVTDDANASLDVFRHDRKKHKTTRVTVPNNGSPTAGGGNNASISSNGRFVAFQSASPALVADDNNSNSDIFVRDLKKGVTKRVSIDSSGVEANGSSFAPWISATGRYVVFQSSATNLVVNDTNNNIDIFIHDRKKKTTKRVSVDSAGNAANDDCFLATVSENGKTVTFHSAASNLVADDTNVVNDVFVRDLKAGVTTRVSVDSAGVESNGGSSNAMVSSDGRYVAFESAATNLVAGDDEGQSDVFLRDLKLGTTTRLSADSNGAGGDGSSGFPWITKKAKFVSFDSNATALVPADANVNADVFVFDVKGQSMSRASVDTAGAEVLGDSLRSAISSNGRFVAFDSAASSLVPNDLNAVRDVFVRDTKD